MAGANTLTDASSLADTGTLTVTGTLTDTGIGAVLGAGVLTVGASGTSIINGITLQGGLLSGAAGGTDIIGTTPVSGAGVITIESGAAVSGFGAIGGVPVVDDGTITATSYGVTLAIETAVTGTGTLAVGGAGTLLTGAAVSGVSIDFTQYGATLSLAAPTSVTSTISGFQKGDVVDLQGLVANTLTYSGGTLTLSKGNTILDHLYFAGNYTQNDFTLKSDNSGGTDVIYAGTPMQEFAAAVLPDTRTTTAFPEHPGDASFISWHIGEADVSAWLSAGSLAHRPL
jgi:hypothetical protein